MVFNNREINMNKYYELFRKNFPFIVRSDEEALKIINNPENRIIEESDEKGNLIGVSIIYKDTIILLCVNEEYRNHGIGSKLLEESEKYVIEKGYEKIRIGVSEDECYLMPGVPMAQKTVEQTLKEDNVYENVNNDAYDFFSKRGYTHFWGKDNCFDMRVNLENATFPNEVVGDTIDGITYRFAVKDDIPNIIKCTDDADQSFSQYYRNEKLYDEKSDQRAIIATNNDEVCGTLIISIEAEGKGIGSVGCTAVSHKYRGRHIAVNMVILGTKYLKSLGLKNGFLGYTYSGLDKMYGYAGYKICIYYMMAQKQLTDDK